MARSKKDKSFFSNLGIVLVIVGLASLFQDYFNSSTLPFILVGIGVLVMLREWF